MWDTIVRNPTYKYLSGAVQAKNKFDLKNSERVKI